MQPFELVISIMIADLAINPIADIGVPLVTGVLPILGLLIMHEFISIINLKSIKMREIICGKPSILIYKGKIQEKELKKENYTINELEERLREKDINDFLDIEYAILETSGEINVIPKPEKRGCTLKDLNITPEYEGLQYDLIIDGKIMKKNLKKLGLEIKWVEKEIKKFKLKPEEVLVATINENGEIFCQGKEKK